MRKRVKVSLIFFGFLTLVLGVYAYKLRSLAAKGNDLFSIRCTEVNPPLISYKNSFLNFADYVNSPDSYTNEEVQTFWEGYISGMREYVQKENDWLNKQRGYLDRWDFQSIEPGYFKEVAEYQYRMYEGYRDEAKYMLESIDAGEMTEEIYSNFSEARERRQDFENLYFDHYDKAVLIQDWRKILSRVPPPSGCTEENMTIPDTSGSIDWDGEENTEQIHINPDLLS